MATKKKMLQAAAGSATGGAGLDIDEVFSTYLYDGNGSTQTITNGIDLDGEGGLVWLKSRTGGTNNLLFDTERGVLKPLRSNDTTTDSTTFNTLTSFNSNGFSIGNRSQDPDEVNTNGDRYASWTFRKAPKFFDVVTYTGNGTNGREIAHDLNSEVGMVVVKQTNTTRDWFVWHKGIGNGWAKLNQTDAASGNGYQLWGLDDGSSTYVAPTSSVVTVSGDTACNQSGGSYVMYLFAHNDGDGGFGPDGDADVIKCGSYTGNGSTTGPVIDLGFEPQWVLVKKATAVQGTTQDWFLFDSMRGWLSGSSAVYGNLALRPNSSGAEWDRNDSPYITSTGFQLNDASDRTNGNGDTYIYIAIRRGPLAPPEDATEVFAVNATRGATNGTASSNAFTSGWPIDLLLHGARNDNDNFTVDRLRGNKYLSTNRTDAEGGWIAGLDDMDGLYLTNTTSATSESCAWMWKRAPGFFDVVAYTGDSYSNRDVTHNLTLKPELVITKKRSSSGNWEVAAKITNTNYHGGLLNSSGSLVNTSLNVSGNAYSQFSDNHFQVG